MPLKKLTLKPGVSRESTAYANEGTWFESDKVRFRSGQPEKIGGWVLDSGTTDSALKPASGAYWGICRSLVNWLNSAGSNLLGIGTHLKYYIQAGVNGALYDVTPLRETTAAGGATFAATNGSRTITVTDTAHGAQAGDFVTFSGAVSLGGNITAAILNAEHRVVTVISSSQYTITVSATANGGDSGNGGASVVAAYQVTTGLETYSVSTGWGAGGWGGVTTGFSSTGWGVATSASLGIGTQMRLWSEAPYGENLFINPRGGAIYYWVNPNSLSSLPRAQKLVSTNTNTQLTTNGVSAAWWQSDTYAPSVSNFIMVSDSSRFLISFGCNDPLAATPTALDPLLVRWSDQENYLTWQPQITNQAGSYRLSHGSVIVTAVQTRQEILVLTDAALYSMQYLGPPYVWGFNMLADNISIMGPNAIAAANNVTYWMGTDKFYMYNGRVATLPCTLWQYVFGDINKQQGYQVTCSTNESYNEIWWFYCSANSTRVDRYVIYNYAENAWAYGTLARTAWLDSPLRSTPVAARYTTSSFTASRSGNVLTVTAVAAGTLPNGTQIIGVGPQSGTTILSQSSGTTGGAGTYITSTSGDFPSAQLVGYTGDPSGILVYHEVGTDDGTVNPPVQITAYIQSGDMDIDDGHNYGFVWRIIPDITFDGSNVNNPTASFTIKPRRFPGSAYGVEETPSVTSAQNYAGQRTYAVQQFTEQVYVRLRGRQMSFRVSSGDVNGASGLGVAWQLGMPRIDLKPDGRK
jgi:hypothetical protein